MKKNILYIIFFMSLIACKQEAIFELEGHSGQALRNGTVGLRYPTAPGRQYFLCKRIRDATLHTFIYHYIFAAKSKSLII